MSTFFSIDFWTTYILPSAVSLALFYLLYKGLVRNDTHFKSRRFAILGGLVFAMVLPFLNVQLPTVGALRATPVLNFTLLQNFIYELPIFTIFAEGNTVIGVETHDRASLQIFNIIGWIYLAVVLFLIGRIFIGFLRLSTLSRNGKRLQTNGATIISSPNIPTAFSFFKTVFIPEMWENSDEKDLVLTHERVHVKQKHSWDLMLMEVICAVQFFNPFVWLLKREMRLNHEYLADKGALKNNENPEHYFQLLLREIVGKQPILVHSFHYSPPKIKQRIMMQISKPAKMLNQVRYLAFIPVALALTILFACQGKSTTSQDSEYIFLNAEQLKSLNIHLSDEGLAFLNFNKNTDERYPFVAIYTTGGGISNSLSFELPTNPEKWDPILQGKEITSFDFVVRRVSNPHTGSVGLGRVDPTDELLVPIAIRWNEVNFRNRTDTTIFWFKPTEDLQKALPKGINMNDFLKIPPAYAGNLPTEADDEDEVFIIVEVNAGFPGGDEARMKFLADNIRFPAEARKKGIQGTVHTSFVVEKDGSLSNVRIIRGIGGGCDEEVIRVIESMPKWIPGQQRGKNVRVQFNLPVRFLLADETPSANE
ncbi:MAG: M56 family metallopeptidase [Bacteroidales bacterium]|jgi:TonB family protein|nr:M56 family metallopeptidase [Bacteroidales bacterium]